MAASRYFEQISGVMNIEAPPTIAAQSLRKSMVEFSRISSQRANNGILPTPIADAFLISVELRGLPASNAWLDGRHHIKSESREGHFTLVNFNVETAVELNFPFDSMQMYFPRAALNAIAVEQGTHAVSALAVDFVSAVNDVVVRNLCHSLLPAFDHPEQANRLFMDHVAMALLTHLVQVYGGSGTAPQMVRGGLAPWQVRRAKELLVARLDGEIMLEELARECGLSRSHFARAFKKTTGKPPHRWLVEQRLERAREMLLKSGLSLGEIADTCGFADQSHFTRAFSASLGVTPSEWRRQRQS